MQVGLVHGFVISSDRCRSRPGDETPGPRSHAGWGRPARAIQRSRSVSGRAFATATAARFAVGVSHPCWGMRARPSRAAGSPSIIRMRFVAILDLRQITLGPDLLLTELGQGFDVHAEVWDRFPTAKIIERPSPSRPVLKNDVTGVFFGKSAPRYPRAAGATCFRRATGETAWRRSFSIAVTAGWPRR